MHCKLGPAILRQTGRASAPEHLAALGDDRFRASALKVCACSQFIGDNWLRHPGLLPELVSSGDLFAPLRRQDYAAALASATATADAEPALARELRLFLAAGNGQNRLARSGRLVGSGRNPGRPDRAGRNLHPDRAGFLYRQACQRWGTPTLADGTPFNIVVLGMGKLGAWELNYSSDIDLIFAYAEDGVLNGKKKSATKNSSPACAARW